MGYIHRAILAVLLGNDVLRFGAAVRSRIRKVAAPHTDHVRGVAAALCRHVAGTLDERLAHAFAFLSTLHLEGGMAKHDAMGSGLRQLRLVRLAVPGVRE